MSDSPGTPSTAPKVPDDNNSSWFGHPPQLAWLFSTELFERFGYYGMRAILALYFAQHYLFQDRVASGLYGAFTSLVYLTPLFGGLLADRYLGSKRSVKFGAIVMSLGYLGLSIDGSAAKPFMEYNNQRYDVVTVADTDLPQGAEAAPEKGAEDNPPADAPRIVKLEGQEYTFLGKEDGSLELIPYKPADGQTVSTKTLAKGTFRFDGTRDPFWVNMLFLSLACVIVGNGFFKPNISTMVGSLYATGDTRRDAGFTIFYMGINLGSLFSQFLCPLLAAMFDWSFGFFLAAVGMLVAWILFQFDGGRLKGYGEPPPKQGMGTPFTYLGAILAIPLVFFLLHNTMTTEQGDTGQSEVAAAVEGTANEGTPLAAATDAGTASKLAGAVAYLKGLPILAKVLFGVFLVAVFGIPLWSMAVGTREEAQKMLVAIVLVVFSVVFWTLFEQAGSSLTFFADRNTNLDVGVGIMPAGMVQIFNPLFIVLFAPVMSILWVRLAWSNLEPSIPTKFAIGLVLVGVGFLTLVIGARDVDDQYRVALGWLVLAYFLHSIGELCLSPVGLSMITKLSIPRVVGLMMGVWFLSSSVAQYVGGIVAQFASVETVGGTVTNPKVALDTYVSVFQTIGWWSIGFGVFLFILSFPLKKMMHGVK
jgi:proton-dependent oligopeptide transporter, POT family